MKWGISGGVIGDDGASSSIEFIPLKNQVLIIKKYNKTELKFTYW